MTTLALSETLCRDGFAFVPASLMRPLLERHGTLTDWPAFAASWSGLVLDPYMADGGRYRRRRHAAYAARSGDDAVIRKPHQAHYQSRDYNPLNGGVARWFEPVLPEIGDGPTMTTILRCCRNLFGRLSPNASWHIEVHQFRIEARDGEAGRPTPEGMHRDGVDWVLVLLIGRRNIASGVTTIHDPDRRTVGSFTLTDPLDAALVDDHRMFHGVTPVEPIDPECPAFRDVLVVTFRRE